MSSYILDTDHFSLATNSILITRNSHDFNKIPHLKFEDWTKPE